MKRKCEAKIYFDKEKAIGIIAIGREDDEEEKDKLKKIWEEFFLPVLELKNQGRNYEAIKKIAIEIVFLD